MSLDILSSVSGERSAINLENLAMLVMLLKVSGVLSTIVFCDDSDRLSFLFQLILHIEIRQ